MLDVIDTDVTPTCLNARIDHAAYRNTLPTVYL